MAELKKTADRAFEFACHLIDEFRRQRPADDAERKIWWQLLDSGPSIAANLAESGGAQSHKDWVTKFHISLKEGRETMMWLRLLKHAAPQRTKQADALLKEVDQIVAILVASLRTAKG